MLRPHQAPDQLNRNAKQKEIHGIQNARQVRPAGVRRRPWHQQLRYAHRPHADQSRRRQSDRVRHHALRHRQHLRRHEVGGVPRRSARRSPQEHRPRDEVRRHDRPGAAERRRLAAARHPGLRGQPAPAQDRLDRPLPVPLPRPKDADRRDARCAERPCPRREGALHRLVQRNRLDGRRRRLDRAHQPPTSRS